MDSSEGHGVIPVLYLLNSLETPLNILYQFVDGMTHFKAEQTCFLILVESEQIKNIFNGVSLIPDILNPVSELVIRIFL